MASLLDSVMGMVGKGKIDPRMLDQAKDLLGDNSPIGGLGGLLNKAQEQGMGDKSSSWVGKGKNLPISPDQIEKLLGHEQVQAIAKKLGIPADKAAKQLSAVLPKLVDQFTPDGKAP